MKKNLLNLFLMVFVLLFSACAVKNDTTPNEKKQVILNMKNEVLHDLYILKPDTKAQITKAEGYAVFSNANIKVFFASLGGGYGVVKDNTTQKHTYMKMGEAGVGLGLGIKDYRVVFVFHTKNSLNNFIENGWTFGAQADVAAKASDQGYSVGGEINHQLNHKRINQHNLTGLSFYGSYYMKKIRIFGRFDQLSSAKIGSASDPWNYAEDGQLIIAGVEISPVKGIIVTPNYQGWIFADGSGMSHSPYLSLEIRF